MGVAAYSDNVRCSNCGTGLYRQTAVRDGWSEEDGACFCPNCQSAEMKVQREMSEAEARRHIFRKADEHWISPGQVYRMRMKRHIGTALTACAILALLAACASTGTPTSQSKPASTSTPQQSTPAPATPTPAPAAPAATPAPSDTPAAAATPAPVTPPATTPPAPATDGKIHVWQCVPSTRGVPSPSCQRANSSAAPNRADTGVRFDIDRNIPNPCPGPEPKYYLVTRPNIDPSNAAMAEMLFFDANWQPVPSHCQ